MTLFLLILAVVGALAYVRLAPSDPTIWHVAPQGDSDKDMMGGALRVAQTGPGGLAALDARAMATPRTERLVGSVDEGMVTYVTRSRVIGFPDYTTAQQDGDVLRVYARLRFGRSDFGVNRNRVDQWLVAAQSG